MSSAKPPEPPTLWIEGADVAYRRRDIRLITDAEYWDIYHRVVRPEMIEARKHGAVLESITIESDYVDSDRSRYTVKSRHQGTDADTVVDEEME